MTASIITVGDGPPVAREWLVDPGIDIPEGATAVHGVTTEQARAEGMDPGVAVLQIVEELAIAWAGRRPVVAFNASYDFTVVASELLLRHGTEFVVAGSVIDPYVIDRHVDKYRKGSRTLSAQVAHYDVTLDGAHTASGDAIAAARVAWRIGCRYPEIAGMALPELHAAQAVWHRERQADFAAYLVRVGKSADDVSGDWPVRDMTAVLAANGG